THVEVAVVVVGRIVGGRGDVPRVQACGHTPEVEFGLVHVELHAQQVGAAAAGGIVGGPGGGPGRPVQALEETGRAAAARVLARAHGGEVGVARVAANEEVAAGVIVQHDPRTVGAAASVVAHPHQRGE